jgi:hypothetical protein
MYLEIGFKSQWIRRNRKGDKLSFERTTLTGKNSDRDGFGSYRVGSSLSSQIGLAEWVRTVRLDCFTVGASTLGLGWAAHTAPGWEASAGCG